MTLGKSSDCGFRIADFGFLFRIPHSAFRNNSSPAAESPRVPVTNILSPAGPLSA